MGQGIGFKDDDGSYGFKLTDDGKVVLGNTADDVIQVTGTLDVNGNLLVNQYIKHKGDANTWINFTDNRIRLNAGGNNFIDCEDPGSAPHKVRINNGGNNIDFVIKDNSNNVYFTADASTSRVGISKADPDYELDVDGTIQSNALICNGLAQITGSLSVSGTLYAGNESPEQYHQITGRLLVDAAGTNNSELIIDGPNPNFIILKRNDSQTGKLATDGSRFTTYGGSYMVSQAYTDGGIGKIDFCSSNTQVTSGTKHKVNITASANAFRIDTDEGTNVFRVSGDTVYATEITASVNISGSGFYGDVHADNIYAAATTAPSSASDTGTAGEIRWDSNYIYVCVAANTWKRAGLSSW